MLREEVNIDNASWDYSWSLGIRGWYRQKRTVAGSWKWNVIVPFSLNDLGYLELQITRVVTVPEIFLLQCRTFPHAGGWNDELHLVLVLRGRHPHYPHASRYLC